MKKFFSLLSIAAFAVAITGSAAFACGKTCADKKNTDATTTSAQLACDAHKTTDVTAASATEASEHAGCPLSAGKYAVAYMKVDGMTCGGCEANLRSKFTSSESVVWIANVSYADGVAKVVYDKSKACNDDMIKLVSSAGYKAEVIPAVVITTEGGESQNGAKTTDASKSGCTKTEGASMTSDKAGCTAKEGASLTGAKADCAKACAGTACAQLTAAERAAFCEKFCKMETTTKTTTSTEKKSS